MLPALLQIRRHQPVMPADRDLSPALAPMIIQAALPPVMELRMIRSFIRAPLGPTRPKKEPLRDGQIDVADSDVVTELLVQAGQPQCGRPAILRGSRLIGVLPRQCPVSFP